mgnify:FL=1
MDRKRMLNDIGIVDFALVELMLFLDTHPDNQEAIDYFNYYAKVKAKMMQEYSTTFEPLTKEYAAVNNKWKWNCGPLPWEGVC